MYDFACERSLQDTLADPDLSIRGCVGQASMLSELEQCDRGGVPEVCGANGAR